MKRNMLFMLIALLFTCFSIAQADETINQTDLKVDNETDKTAPVILKSIVPGFPMKAERAHVEGFVIIKFLVTRDGKVENPVVLESVPQDYFEAAALNALKKYEFKPATEYGIPVDYTIEWPFFFSFSNSSFSDDTESRLQACRNANNGKDLIEKGKYQNAVEEISKALKLEPQYVTPYYYRSLAFMKMEQYEKSISDIEKAIELAPNIFGYFNHRGSLYLFKKEYKKAIENFNKSIQIEPRNIIAYIHRGDTHRELKEYQKAIEDYTTALDLDNSLIHVHNNRGYTYYKLKDNNNACMDFEKACELGDCRAFEHLKNKGVCNSDSKKE